MLFTPVIDFSNISWNWICYQQAYLTEMFLTLFADAILLQIWLYTHMPSLVGIVWKTNEILHIVQSGVLGVCLSIVYRQWFLMLTLNLIKGAALNNK